MNPAIITALFLAMALSPATPTAKPNLEKLKNEVDNICSGIDKDKNISDKTWVSKKIKCMVERDQLVRKETIEYEYDAQLISYMNQLDEAQTKDLKEILKVHGWLVISKFGKKVDGDAWLLVQHADHDPMFQASIAFLLEQLYPLGETNPTHYAYLFDRVCLKYQSLGLKKKFGTQTSVQQEKAVLQPYKGTLKEVNMLREKFGLEPIEAYLETIKKFYITKEKTL